MPTVRQVLEKFVENPEEIIGQILVAVDRLHQRVEYLENLLSQDDPDAPENWDNEESHLT